MTRPSRYIKAAEYYRSLGFDVLPVIGKAPCPPYTSRVPFTDGEWPHQADGIALILNNYVVVDIDPRNDGWEGLNSLTEGRWATLTWRSKTKGGGVHYYFRAPPADYLSKPAAGVDVLTGYRYCLEYPTPGYHWERAPWDFAITSVPRWVPIREPLPLPSERPASDLPYDVRLDRARAYCNSYPPAVSGNGGHRVTFILAQRLVHQFALSDADALTELTRWNSTCAPPWSDKELRHKVSSARRHGTMRQGVRS